MRERPRQWLPEDLEAVPPGPQLATLLATVDRRALSDTDRLRLAQARNRLVSHQEAELLADVYATSWDEPPDEGGDPGQASRFPFSEVELALAMCWTRTAAGGRLEQARQLLEDLPAVHASLQAGEIDMPNGRTCQ